MKQPAQVKKKAFLKKGKGSSNLRASSGTEEGAQREETNLRTETLEQERVIKSNSPDKDIPWWEKSSGQDVASDKKKKRKEKKSPPKTKKFSTSQERRGTEEEQPEEEEEHQKEVDQKKEFLKRRTKYDPQKAIKEAEEKQLALRQLNSNDNSK